MDFSKSISIEALSLLQAEHEKSQVEVNKLQVEKEFLEKQLATKDSKIEELEKANRDLLDDMADTFDEGFKDVRTQGSILPTVTLTIISSTGRWCPSTLGSELLLVNLHLFVVNLYLQCSNLFVTLTPNLIYLNAVWMLPLNSCAISTFLHLYLLLFSLLCKRCYLRCISSSCLTLTL